MTDAGQPSDGQLAKAAAGGDERAYAELMSRHKSGLYRLTRRFLGDPDEAVEAVQETFIAAWGALGRYDPARPFGAWLRTIAINKARDRGRRMAFRRLIFGSRPLEDAGALEKPDEALAPDAGLIARQRAVALDRAIAGLPDSLKAPLLLTAIEGLSQQEAAEILGVSVKGVETRVYRARRILARTLDPDLRPSP